MNVHMDAQMFEFLFETSMEWGESWRAHDGRFENHDSDNPDTPPSYDWKIAYWFGNDTAAMILARSWIIEQGYGCALLNDLAEHPNGDPLGWVLLTDYESPVWTRGYTREAHDGYHGESVRPVRGCEFCQEVQ